MRARSTRCSQYHPKAVVVDFLFVDTRPDDTLPELVEEIARYKKAGVPLYFEGGIDLPFGENPLRPEIAATGVPILDPTIPIYDGVARQYNATGAASTSSPVPMEPAIRSRCTSSRMSIRNIQLDTAERQDGAGLGHEDRAGRTKWITKTDDDGKTRSCYLRNRASVGASISPSSIRERCKNIAPTRPSSRWCR